MRIAVLTHAEAADSAVFANLAKHLLAGNDTISYVDRPDTGTDAPLALAQPVPSPSPAALAFGGQAQAAPAPAPQVAPAPAVPSTPSAATAPTAAPAASGVTVDAAGLPWDVRIHSSNKAFVADGTWRQRRGTSPELLAQVEAELRQTMGLPAPAAAAPAPVAAPVPQPPAANSVFGAAAIAAGLPQPALVPQPPAAAATPTPQPAGDPTTFAEMMLWLTPHMPHKLAPETLNAMLQASGVPSLNALISRPDLVPGIVAAIKPLLA